MTSVVTVGLVIVGVALIALGAWMSLQEWKVRPRERDLGSALTGLAKLLEALKAYPTGQRLIVFGIVVLIIAGLFGGISGL